MVESKRRHSSRKQPRAFSPRRSRLLHAIHVSQSDKLLEAGIDREHDALERNKVWTYVERKQGMHDLPSTYVFKVRNGGPKVRIVVLGCRQLYGIDFFETFAPVVKMTTVRIILALVACAKLEREQMDVVTAFLCSDLEEDIFKKVPDGSKNQNGANMVCKLRKSLYGFNQAPRQWYARICQQQKFSSHAA